MKTNELLSYGFPQKLIDVWEARGFKELLPIQTRAIKERALLDNPFSNLLIIAPTSSGKTFVGELAAVKEALDMRKSLLLVPFRAIAEELYADFNEKYRDYGLRIVISDRDHREYDEEITNGAYDIAIVVYEKLVGLLIAKPQLFAGCGLLIADEVQMVMDVDRGPSIELLLTRILLSKKPLRIVALSAVLDKLNDFDRWLRSQVLIERNRPIELREAIYTNDGNINYHEFNSRKRGTYKLQEWNLREEALLNLLQSVIDKDEQALVFCSTRNSTVSIAHRIAANIQRTSASAKTIKRANELPDSSEREEIQNLLNVSVAYHNSDLALDERLLIQDGFRKKDIRIVACTSTLSMGVNLPSQHVIVYKPEKWNGERFVSISVADYKNMSGRAGRYSTGDLYGTSYLISESEATTDAYFSKYITGSLEGFSSAFGEQDIDSQVLQIVAGDLGRTTKEITDIIFSTYNGQHRWRSEQSKVAIGQMISNAIKQCVDCGAVEQLKNGILRATEAGQLCAVGGYSLEHLRRAVSYLNEYKDDVDPSVIFWALTADYYSGPNAYYIGRIRTGEYRSGLYQRLLVELADDESIGSLLQRLADHPESITYDETVILRRCLACNAWISSIPVRKIIDSFPGVTIGSIRNTAEVCAWLISFLCELCKSQAEQSNRQNVFVPLVEKLSHGATIEALGLCRIKGAGLSRDERNNLVSKGIQTIDDVLDCKLENFPLSRAKALRLIRAAESTITESLDKRKRIQRSRLSAISVDVSILTDLYEKDSKDLEIAVDNVLKPPFLGLVCRRISKQRGGEPDHLLYDKEGKVFAIQTTARDRKNVNMTKATSVIGQSSKYKPKGYIVFGRPDFDDFAIKDSHDQVMSGRNYKLMPISTLAEMFVLFHEKRITADDVEKTLLEKNGYIGLKELLELCQ